MKFLTGFRVAVFLLTALVLAYPVAAQDKGPAKALTLQDPVTSGCTGGEHYKTCTSGLYELGAAEERKDGSVFCPGGHAALGGGYLGLLNTASVQGSRPLTGDAKGRTGWTVTVARSLSQGIGPVKFVVQVICAPDS